MSLYQKTAFCLLLSLVAVVSACEGDVIQSYDGSCPDCGALTCCQGKCVDIMHDVMACGSCNNACAPGNTCNKGQCQPPAGSSCKDGCGNGLCCGDACTDISSDPEHCGSCDNACPPESVCDQGKCRVPCTCDENQLCNENGACVPACGGVICKNNEICCQDACVPKNDKNNCGTCGNACNGDTPVCQNGTCTSDCDPMTDCNGVCVDTTRDDQNCGTCGHACGPNSECRDSDCACKSKTCAELGFNCGKTDDGCGNELDCGTCIGDDVCQENHCGCQHKTCTSLGKNCGTIDDGCGGTLNCGTCASDLECTNNISHAAQIKPARITSAAPLVRQQPAQHSAKTAAPSMMVAEIRSTAGRVRARRPVKTTCVNVIQHRVQRLAKIVAHTVTAVAERSIVVRAVSVSRVAAADASRHISLIRRVKALRGFSRISKIPIRSLVTKAPGSP